MTLTAAGPAGTAHDPFAGTVPDDGAELSFPADRYAAVGATEQDVADLSAYFDGLTRQEQRAALAWHDARDDEQLAESLAAFRQARDAFTGLGGLTDEQLAESLAAFRQARDAFTGLGGLTDEQLAELAALSPEDRAALAELSGAEQPTPEQEQADALAAEQQAAYDALSDDEKTALAALTPEQLAELRPETAAGDATSAAGGSAEPPATSDTGQPESAAQTAFTTDDIADLTIPQVEALIEKGDVTAAAALAAEQARGADARKTLVEKLTALAAE